MHGTEPPEWVRCIRHTHIDKLGTAWCGRVVTPAEHLFFDPGHAANNGMVDGHLVACPSCVQAVTAALRNGHDQPELRP